MDRGENYEEQHVHSIYEEIAPHFSSTRYKPWPLIERFLRDLPNGSVGLDIGCGNGKYLAVNKNVFIIASDRSSNLVRIATQHAPHTAVVADILDLPHAPNSFDFAISIAVIHHLSTPERRIEAVSTILDVLITPPSPISGTTESSNGGKALLYVWALEQRDSRRGWDEGHVQDVMVPWVLKSGKGKQREEKTFQRYYHLYKKGELEDDIRAAGGVVLESGYEKDNWWAIAARKPFEVV